MTTIIKLPLYVQIKLGLESGPENEYVPLAEHKALETHIRLLAWECYELKELLRQIVEIVPALFDDEKWNREGEAYENEQSNELFQLLLDCREVLK